VKRRAKPKNYTINDIHWLPAEHMLHVGLVKRTKGEVKLYSKPEIKRDVESGNEELLMLMNHHFMIENGITPDFLFARTDGHYRLLLCVFLLPDERWGVEHTDITEQLRLLDKCNINFLLLRQQANYSEGRMEAIISDVEKLLDCGRLEEVTEREGGS